MEYTDLFVEIRKEFPSFQIINKSESFFMKLIAFFLLLVTFGQQKTFLTSYTTTIGQRVYVPFDWNEWLEPRKIAILRHERVHMRQAKKYTLPVFAFFYLLVPLPIGLAYCRARFEWEAYTESMRVRYQQGGIHAIASLEYKNHIVSQFTSGAYGWMWPFRKTVERWYDEARAKILEEGP